MAGDRVCELVAPLHLAAARGREVHGLPDQWIRLLDGVKHAE
jgi:hypothetical protein